MNRYGIISGKKDPDPEKAPLKDVSEIVEKHSGENVRVVNEVLNVLDIRGLLYAQTSITPIIEVISVTFQGSEILYGPVNLITGTINVPGTVSQVSVSYLVERRDTKTFLKGRHSKPIPDPDPIDYLLGMDMARGETSTTFTMTGIGIGDLRSSVNPIGVSEPSPVIYNPPSQDSDGLVYVDKGGGHYRVETPTEGLQVVGVGDTELGEPQLQLQDQNGNIINMSAVQENSLQVEGNMSVKGDSTHTGRVVSEDPTDPRHVTTKGYVDKKVKEAQQKGIAWGICISFVAIIILRFLTLIAGN